MFIITFRFDELVFFFKIRTGIDANTYRRREERSARFLEFSNFHQIIIYK